MPVEADQYTLNGAVQQSTENGAAPILSGQNITGAKNGTITEAMLTVAVANKLNNSIPFNVAGTVAPGINNDINDSVNSSNGVGFEVGSLWIAGQPHLMYIDLLLLA